MNLLVVLDYGDILVNIQQVHERQFRALRLFGVRITRERARKEWGKVKKQIHEGKISLREGMLRFWKNIGLGGKSGAV